MTSLQIAGLDVQVEWHGDATEPEADCDVQFADGRRTAIHCQNFRHAVQTPGGRFDVGRTEYTIAGHKAIFHTFEQAVLAAFHS